MAPTTVRERLPLAVSRVLAARCFGALTRGFSAMSAGEGTSGPRSAPLRKACRPGDGTTVHRLDGHRCPAHRSRGRRVRRPRRRAAGARRSGGADAPGGRRARTRARREGGRARRRAKTRDERLAKRDRSALDRGARRRTARASSSSRATQLGATCGHSRSRSSGWTSSSRNSSACRRGGYGALSRRSTILARADREPRERAPHPARPRPLGRDPAARVIEIAGMLPHCDFVSRRPRRRTTVASAPRPHRAAARRQARSWSTRRSPLAAYLDAYETHATRQSVQRTRRPRAPGSRPHRQLAAKAYWRQLPTPGVRRHVPPRRDVPPRRARARQIADEHAWSSNVILASPRTLIVLLRAVARPGSRRRSPRAPARSRLSAASSTSGSRRWARTSRSSGASLDGAVDAYNKTVGSLERQVLPRRDGSSSTGSPVSSRPSCSRSSVRHVRWQRAELVEPGQQQTLEAVAASDVDAA